MIKKIKEKKVFLALITIIAFLIITAIAYLVFQKKPEERKPELLIPPKDRTMEKVLESLTPPKDREPMSEEERQALEKALESLTLPPEQTSEVPEEVLESLTPPK